MLLQRLQHRKLGGCILVRAGAGGFSGLRDPAFEYFEIRKDKLQIDGLDIPRGIDGAVDMDHVLILKAAYDVHDRVAFAYIGKKLVTEALALRRAPDKACDIDKIHGGRRCLAGMAERRKKREPLIRHRHDADIRVDRAERVVRRFRTRLRQRIKQRALPDVRESYDSEFHILTDPFRSFAFCPASRLRPVYLIILS